MTAIGSVRDTVLRDSVLVVPAKIKETEKADKNEVLFNKSYGITPLMEAASNGDFKKVKALIAAGANVNARNKLGCTVLMYATGAFTFQVYSAGNGHVNVIKALIAAGADVNAKDNDDGETALMGAAKRGYGDLAKDLS